MPNELEPTPSYDPEVEKKRIEAYEAIQKATQDQQKTLQEGWQKVATSVVEAFRSHATRSKEIEERSFWLILVTIIIFVIVVGLLTWQGIVPAEGFTFLVGIVVGYLISLSPLARIIGR